MSGPPWGRLVLQQMEVLFGRPDAAFQAWKVPHRRFQKQSLAAMSKVPRKFGRDKAEAKNGRLSQTISPFAPNPPSKNHFPCAINTC
jgi:hypothetical protein